MKNAIYGITKGDKVVIMLAFLTGLLLTMTMAVSFIVNGLPHDAFVAVFALVIVAIGWFPFVAFVQESMHHVNGWSYEAGCYDRWMTYRDVDMHVFVSKRPKVRNAYRVAFMADDYDDPFEGHCYVIVHEYDDYGTLNNVLSNAETTAISLIVEELSNQ